MTDPRDGFTPGPWSVGKPPHEDCVYGPDDWIVAKACPEQPAWLANVEETPEGERVYRAPWIRTFPAEHIHRIRLIDGRVAWTICIVFKATRAWGFWHLGQWVPWRKYVDSSMADARVACRD